MTKIARCSCGWDLAVAAAGGAPTALAFGMPAMVTHWRRGPRVTVVVGCLQAFTEAAGRYAKAVADVQAEREAEVVPPFHREPAGRGRFEVHRPRRRRRRGAIDWKTVNLRWW